MADETEVFDDKAIRDTNSHNSSNAMSGEMECKNLFILNGLNQQVTLQLQGSSCTGETWINIGSSFNVAATTNTCQLITDYFSLYRVQASCVTAPTTGNLSITVLKMGR